jgi:hypothetical protein
MNQHLTELLNSELGWPGRMIASSKSGYYQRHPNNLVVFNANIIDTEGNKVWFGDIDVTVDKESLQEIAMLSGCSFFILREHDARFGNEDKPLIENFVARVEHSNIELGEEVKKYQPNVKL